MKTHKTDQRIPRIYLDGEPVKQTGVWEPNKSKIIWYYNNSSNWHTLFPVVLFTDYLNEVLKLTILTTKQTASNNHVYHIEFFKCK